MATLKEAAQTYVPNTTKNIAELEQVSVDVEILEGQGINQNGEQFVYKYIVQDNVEYRVPNPVLEQLKEQMEHNKNLKAFRVSRKGQGQKDTKYTVVPL